jgi:hypothetical protein
MLKLLMLVSGWIEVLFGVSALFAPLMLVEAVGGTATGVTTLALIRMLGAATLGLGVGALVGRNHLETQGSLAAAYGLGLYNVIGALALILGAVSTGSAGLWGGAVLHTVIGLLFCYALLARR